MSLSRHFGFALIIYGSSLSSSYAILRYLDVAKSFEFHSEMDFSLLIRFYPYEWAFRINGLIINCYFIRSG